MNKKASVSPRFMFAHWGLLNESLSRQIHKWLRHDPDHGKEYAIRKTWRDLGETLNVFGFKSLPENSYEFNRLHESLINDLAGFLEQLLTKIKSKKITRVAVALV